MGKLNGNKILLAIILVLLGAGLSAGGYFLGDVKDKAELNTQENYVQIGDIRVLNQSLQVINKQMGKMSTALDSIQIALNVMNTKLTYLVNGY